MRHPHALRFSALAALVLSACGKEEPPGHSGGALPPPPLTASATATATATASAISSASAAPSLPSADPVTVHTSAPTASAQASAVPSAKPDAGAKPPKPVSSAIADAGASDAGPVAASDAGAAANPAMEIAQRVDAIFGAKKTFAAKFKQQYTIKTFSGPPKESSGVVFMERPNKISFRYDAPRKDRVVSDGATIRIYQADDNQMIETPMAKTEYPGALAFMMGNGISKSFDFAINPKAKWDSGVVLDGKPLTPNPSYDLAMFYIDKPLLDKGDPNTMKRVLVIDAQGNKNRFDFTEVTQPDKIDPAEFAFTPPPGTDIKRQGP